jgi:glycosyltransferase involved in cell wall biosynthesis
VIFAGFREDVPRIMRSFDLFALTSDFEGFGLVLLEAMSAGKPILATCVSAIPEVVQDGETGFLVPKQDHNAFTSAALRLLDPHLREAMGAAGERRVRELFLPSVMVQRTIDLYAKALDAQRTAAAQ